MSLNMEIYSLIIILVALLILLIGLIAILLRIKRRTKTQESIPGVEEMASTTFFWSEYHRGKIGDDGKYS
jgi:Tfp pilus assembly protein PilV